MCIIELYALGETLDDFISLNYNIPFLLHYAKLTDKIKKGNSLDHLNRTVKNLVVAVAIFLKIQWLSPSSRWFRRACEHKNRRGAGLKKY